MRVMMEYLLFKKTLSLCREPFHHTSSVSPERENTKRDEAELIS